MLEALDAIGQDLNVDDEVAYVHRHGSSVFIDRRTVTSVLFSNGEYLLGLDGGRPMVKTRNTVRI